MLNDLKDCRLVLALLVISLSPFWPNQTGLAEVPAAQMPRTSEEWQTTTRADVSASYQMLLENHAGVHDPENPGFAYLLLDAKEAGLSMAANVTGPSGYAAALQRFSAILDDGHAGVYPTLTDAGLPQAQWPGFVTVWRTDALMVYASEPGGPSVGSEVVSCDGIPIKTVIERNVFAFRGRAHIEGMWWAHARKVFFDNGNPFIQRPEVCVFLKDGRETELVLTYRAANSNSEDWIVESYNGDRLPIGISEPAEGLKWIALPEFQPDAAGVEAYEAMVRSISDNRGEYLRADAIVLDLRHNQGGNSAWSERVAGALWGEGRVGRRLAAYNVGVEIWWRANAQTADHVRSMVETLREQGLEESVASFAPVVSGIETAISSGQQYHVEAFGDEGPIDEAGSDLPSDPPALTIPVYVIVPGQCASACNDALDAFTRFENVKLIGAPGSNDSSYMEVRFSPVPSGLAQVIIPVKIWMGRAREAKDFYQPAITVDALDWSTNTFVQVVLNDLKRRPSDH